MNKLKDYWFWSKICKIFLVLTMISMPLVFYSLITGNFYLAIPTAVLFWVGIVSLTISGVLL